jgi:hypothetical protein
MHLTKLPIALSLVISVSFSVCAQVVPENLRPFTSICVSDNSVGYFFRDGTAHRAPELPSTRYVVKKLDPQLYKNSTSRNVTYSMCRDTKPATFLDGRRWTYACYDVRDSRFGPAPIARTCTEQWDAGGGLVQVVCDEHKFAFHPAGPFVRTSTADLSRLVSLEAGKCEQID